MRQRKETPPRRGAVALRYQAETDRAPKVVAKGYGEVADRIIQLAKEHNVPIRENADLLAVLSKVELMDEVPAELYRVVAEILAYVYSVNIKMSQSELNAQGKRVKVKGKS